jgi:cell division initiation protein
MPLTPVEIRHIQMRRAWLRGYRRRPVEQLLAEIADSFEEVWRERADLADRLEELETEIGKHRELEAVLRSTLVSAERAGQDMKEQARREADLIVQEAHAEARRVTRESAAEKRRLEEDVVRIRAQLRAAFDSLGEEWPGDEPKAREEEPQTAVTRPTPVEDAPVEDAPGGGIREVAG